MTARPDDGEDPSIASEVGGVNRPDSGPATGTQAQLGEVFVGGRTFSPYGIRQGWIESRRYRPVPPGATSRQSGYCDNK
jgi:hypothetical protein